MSQTIIRTVEFKLYPNKAQEAALASWLITCCWIYNTALNQRKEAYNRRKESVTRNQQFKLLTAWRARIEHVHRCPVLFARGALRRVDRGMQAFFRRVKLGQKPGFPRYRARKRRC